MATAQRLYPGGLLQVYSNFDEVTFNPTSGQVTNLFPYSQNFSPTTPWVKYSTTDTVYLNTASTLAPDGTTSSTLIIPGTNSGYHMFTHIGLIFGTGTISIFAKPAGYNYIGLSNGPYNTTKFNLTATSVAVLGSGWTTASIASVGNGWCRAQVSSTGSVGWGTMYLEVPNNLDQEQYAGDGVNGVYIWGAQVETNPTASIYVPTTAGVVSSSPGSKTVNPGIIYTTGQFDEVTYNSTSSYIVNNLQNSQYFTSTNWATSNSTVFLNTTTVTAPDGTLTATKLMDLSGSGYHYLSYITPFNLNSGTSYTFSLYAKAAEIPNIGVYIPSSASGAKYNLTNGSLISNDANITSSIVSYPNGWWRINATYSAPSSTVNNLQIYLMNPGTSYSATGGQGLYIWGAQFEPNATTSSIYVATTSTTSPSFASRVSSQGNLYVPGYFDEVTLANPVPTIVTNGLLFNIDMQNWTPSNPLNLLDSSGNGNNFTFYATPNITTYGYVANTGTSQAYWYGPGNNGAVASTAFFPGNINYSKSAVVWTPNGSLSNIIGSTSQETMWGAGTSYLYAGNSSANYQEGTSSPTTFSVGQWMYVGVSYNTSTGWHMYINGSLVGTNASSVSRTSSSTPQLFSYSGNANNSIGKIAAALLYNRELTTAEHLQNYNYYITRYNGSSPT